LHVSTVQQGLYRKVPTAHRLMMLSIDITDLCDVTSYSWRHSLQSRRIRKLHV